MDLPLGSLTAFVGAPYFLLALRASEGRERDAPLLEARGLVVRARRAAGAARRDARAATPGEALALVGPNAAGKSTLVRALAGLLRRDGGRGAPATGARSRAWPRDALARARGAGDAGGGRPPTPSRVEDRVRARPLSAPRAVPPADAADDDAAVARALRPDGHRAPGRAAPLGTLSAGERQLAALARGLAQEPRVLLLDEPAAHLDIGHQLRLFRVLDEVRAGGVAVLAVVHDLQRAAAWAERMVLLDGGPRRRGGRARRGARRAPPARAPSGSPSAATRVPGPAASSLQLRGGAR